MIEDNKRRKGEKKNVDLTWLHVEWLGEKDAAKCNDIVLCLALSNSEPISLKIRFVGHALQNAHDASNHSAGRRGG
jgi:hypothetical protein